VVFEGQRREGGGATDVSAKTDIRLNDGPFLATTAGISSRLLLREGAATYSVDYTADLSLPWTEIARDVTGPFTETDAGRTANRASFYRARIGGN